MTALFLGSYGLALSLVVPELLARSRWTARVPRASVVLWQAVTLASVLCAVGVVLAAPEELLREVGSGPVAAQVVVVGAIAVAVLIVVRLLLSVVAVSRRSRARRERHRMLVDLLDSAEAHGGLEHEAGPGLLRVLDGPLPFAYCLPGRSPRVVLSGGALRALDRTQVRAVLAHEQGHLRSRHDLVLESFTALHHAVPAPLRSRTSLDAVHLLLELLADDVSRRRHGATPLRTALATLGGAVDGLDPIAEDGGGRDLGDERRRRLERLTEGAPGPSRVLGGLAYTAAGAVLVLPTIAIVLPWLDRALLTWPF